LTTTPPEVSPSQGVYQQLHEAVSTFRSAGRIPPITGPDLAINFTVCYNTSLNLLSGAAEISLVAGTAPVDILAVYMALSASLPPATSPPYCEAVMGPAMQLPSPPIALPRRLIAYSNKLAPFADGTTVYGVAIVLYSFNGQQLTGIVSVPAVISQGISEVQQLQIMHCAG
jgi:hypothetical protein